MSSPKVEEVIAKLKPGTIYYRDVGIPFFKRTKGSKEEEEEDDYVETVKDDSDDDDDKKEDERRRKLWEKEIDEEELKVEDEDEDEGEEEEVEIDLEEEEKEEKPKEIVTFEAIEDLVNERVDLPTRLKEFNKQYGLDSYVIKLVPKSIVQKIVRYETSYRAKEMVRVDEDGKHVIVRPELGEIRIIDPRLPSRMKRSRYSPSEESVENNFDKRYPIGVYVSFRSLSGPVVAFDSKGITVSVAKDEVKFYEVPYSDPSLKVIPLPDKKLKETKRLQVDIRALQKVPQDLRDLMINAYVPALTKIMGIEEVKEDKDKDIIGSAILQTPEISFDEYYANQFTAWTRMVHLNDAMATIDGEQIIEEARKMEKMANSTKTLIQDAVGEIEMDENTTIYNLQAKMSEIKNLSPVQAHVVRFLNREILEGHGLWKGRTLNGALSAFIQDLKHFHHVTVDDCYKILVDANVELFFDNYIPTDVDRKNFEEQHLSALKTLYSQYIEERQKTAFKPKSLTAPSILLPKEEVNILGKVKEMENIVYQASGSVMKYMQTMVHPYIFLVGPLSKYAKYLHAKLKNRSFPIEKLADANLSILLPEIPMNMSLSDKDWKLILSTITFLQEYEVDKFLSMYTSIQNPTHPLEHLNIHPDIGSIIRPIAKFMVDLKKCPGNKRRVVKNGRYVYVPGTTEYQTEPIPEEDLIIYFDKNTKQFSCHDSKDIIRSISANESSGKISLVNPVTGVNFSDEFIKKMKGRKLEKEPDEPLPEEKEVEKKVEIIRPAPKPPQKLPVLKQASAVTGKYITTVALKGEPFEIFHLFNSTATITDAFDKERSVKVSETGKPSETRAVVVGLIGDDYEDIKRGVEKIKEPAYLVVQTNINLSKQSSLTKKIKAKNSKLIEIFYIPTRDSEFEVRKVVQKVVNKEEGKIAGQK